MKLKEISMSPEDWARYRKQQQQACDKHNQVMSKIREHRLRNSRRPEIWTYREKESEAKLLERRLGALALELGIDS